MEQQALRTELNLSVSGGGKANQYFFSAGYLNDKGIALESGYQRFNLRSNITSEMTSWLKGGVNLSFAHSMQNYPVSSDSKTSNVITAGRTMPGFYPIYEMNTDGSYKLDENGDRIYDFGSYRPSGSMANWNLPATLPLDKSERMKDEVSGRTFLEATIIEGLKFKTSFNFDLINYNTLDYTNPKLGPAKENGGGVSRMNTRTFSWTWNNIATYDKTIGEHHFNVLAGVEAYSYRYDELTASRSKMAQPDMPELVVGSQLTRNFPSGSPAQNVKNRRDDRMPRRNIYFDSRIMLESDNPPTHSRCDTPNLRSTVNQLLAPAYQAAPF